jgi:hypothetical protein
MKTKINVSMVCMLILILLTSLNVLAQQPQHANPENTSTQLSGTAIPANYTYKVFQAPNKMYGFDIFKNGKFIFHQPASVIPPVNSPAAISKKEDAEKVAQLSIEKIKKGQTPALTDDEIKKILTQ